ncbi:hypothetical protein N7468_002317 [Penicillium chermesinum]|uniref:Uncharacterized protein n=1 Tax=Penicillium chermesinum TaxID=63820 RepID=A0A9W9PII3_9EURO|nr:uncharacterized protein N7468_002317 [Penicillium chermesinum]KAJ5247334.1 hypothetical protein N7468_002317 [Penicillium chermesinum]
MPLETFLPPPELSDIHLLLTQDWNGMNNGVFFIRVHEWSVKLLAAAISYTTVHPDADLYWTDQSALDNIFEDVEFFSKSVLYCPLRWFNAYMRSPDGLSPNKDSPDRLQVHPGDLLVHFPGTPPDDLVQTMEPYIQIAEGHHKEWELPVEETAYVKIVKEFWDKERRRAGYPEPSMTWSSSEPS